MRIKKSFLLLSTALILSGCNKDTADIAWLDALKAYFTGHVPEKYLVNGLPDDMQIAFDNQQYDDAIQSPTGSYLAGRFAQSNFDWETASKYFAQVLAADPANAELLRRSMVLSMGAGDYQATFDYARKAVKIPGGGSLPRLFLALETMKSGNYAQVLTDIQQVPDDGISEFVKPLMRSWAAAGEKKLDITSLNKNVVHFYHAILIADYLNDQNALRILAQRDYLHLGLSAKSLKQIADIFVRHDLNLQAKLILGALPAGEDKDQSNPPEKINTPIDGMARALFDMATVLYQDYPDSARLFTEMSLYLDPSENDSRILMAHMASQFHRYDEAISLFNQIDTSKDPELAIKARRQIAELLVEAGKPDQAIDALHKVVDQTKSVDAQIQIGDIYREEENFKSALVEYNKAFALLNNNVTNDHWNLLYSRGISNERLKNWDAAEKDLKAALVLQPNHPYILNYLGYSWTDQGKNLEEATHMIEKAVRLKPDDGYIVDSLGWAYYRQGKYAQSVEALEHAIELSPYDPTINDHLGDAYWQVGRKSEARSQWRRALSLQPDAELKTQLETKVDKGLASSNSIPSADDSHAAQTMDKFFSHD